jgi:hypothetical protein
MPMVLILYYNCYLWQWKYIEGPTKVGALSDSSCCWLVAVDGRITDLGYDSESCPSNASQSYDQSIDCKKGLLIPGLNGKRLETPL